MNGRHADSEDDEPFSFVLPASESTTTTKEYQDKAQNASNNSVEEMSYDANGNMTKDLDRDIVTIKYNLLNLPDLIQFKNGCQIKNTYSADGQKLSSRYVTVAEGVYQPLNPGQVIDNLDVNENDNVTVDGTDYIGNIEYQVDRYFDWDLTYEPVEQKYLYRVHNPEGYVSTFGLGSLYGPVYNYYRKDHLGNNREVWSASYKWGSATRPAATNQITQYYPSGLPWASNTGDNPGTQPYKYGGKEFVEMHGLDEYDSEARWYYPAIMRTTTMDPLAEKYYDVSPYAWCGNNPVNRIDPDGMDWFQNNKTGDVTFVSNLHNGAEKNMEDGWMWLGPNNMFMSDKYDIENSDQVLAANNGGDFQYKENNPMTSKDNQSVVSMLLKGEKATKFMSDKGYEFKPTQQIRFENEITFHPESGINIVTGERTYITEKSEYIPKGAIEDKYTPLNDLLYKDNVTVNRMKISYTTNIIKKGLNALMPFVGYHDQRIPTVYPSIKFYPRDNKYINLFLRTRK